MNARHDRTCAESAAQIESATIESMALGSAARGAGAATAVRRAAALHDGIRHTLIRTTLGTTLLTGDGRSLSGLYFEGQKDHPDLAHCGPRDDDAVPFAQVREKFAAYERGELAVFDVPLALHGTPFQREVWQALLSLGFGQSATYSAIAAKIGRPKAVRAVGAAVGRNPVSVIVPCHRVLGADGSLTGYAGGLERKRALLRIEGIRHGR